MAATLIDGKAVAEDIRRQVAEEAAGLREAGRPVRLTAVQVGEDPASKVYTDMQARDCKAVGIDYELLELPEETTQEGLIDRIKQLDADAACSGIILQMPLPDGFDTPAVQRAIDPGKDVEGIHPENLGRLVSEDWHVAPCTPLAAMELLQRACPELSGKEAVVVGRSVIVGKPIAALLAQKAVSATVTICHSRTRDLAAHTRRADVLIAATGLSQTRWQSYRRRQKAGEDVERPDLGPLITGEMVGEGAVVIDVATNRIPKGFDESGEPLRKDNGKLAMRTVGDVDFEAAGERASAITPVPGGVGPVTVAMLLRNTLACAKAGRR